MKTLKQFSIWFYVYIFSTFSCLLFTVTATTSGGFLFWFLIMLMNYTGIVNEWMKVHGNPS